MEHKGRSQKIVDSLIARDSRVLILAPVYAAIVLVLIVAIIVNTTAGPLPDGAGNLFVLVLAVLLCSSGIMQIVKSEIPGTPIRGVYARAMGVVWVILWGVVGIISLWGLIVRR
jgi:hypothetical protein